MQKVKRLLNQILGFIPSRLPQGMSEFDAWADSITATYKLPTLDRDSVVFVLASTIMRLDPGVVYRPKVYFVHILQNSAAKQIAGAQFSALKQKQAAQQQAEATALKAVANENQTTSTTNT